ncbi:hypothetical protein [Bacteroides acidifaciens]|uniref:hypothetical protein n=1 Tax=Bacteroides acidifaciens TaxID=85831 RepID=UPI00158F2C91|nr:hypothetical protein [Bacteroides acidifaciens]
MKAKSKEVRKTTIVLTSIFILLFLGACSSNEFTPNGEEKVKADAYTQLSENLDLYNQSYLKVNTCPQTRGWWHKWNWFNTRGKYIVSCDALGARVGARWGRWGALGGAVGASLIAALFSDNQVVTVDDKFTCKLQNASLPLNSNEDRMIDSESLELDSIGYYHNEIMLSIERKIPDVYNQNLDTDEVMSIVSGEMKELDCPMPEERIIKEIFNETSALIPSKDIFLSEEAFVSHLESVQPEYLQDYKIINDYLITTQKIAKENIQDYTEGVVRVVQESELQQEEKQALVGSILVGGNSVLLWTEVDSEISDED